MIYKTKDWAIWTPLKKGVNSGAPERLAVPAPLVTHVMLLLNIVWYRYPVHASSSLGVYFLHSTQQY